MYMTYTKLVISTITIILAEDLTADAPRCASRLRHRSCSYLIQLTTSADHETFARRIAIASANLLC